MTDEEILHMKVPLDKSILSAAEKELGKLVFLVATLCLEILPLYFDTVPGSLVFVRLL